jgi:hypothetical protein
VLLGGFGMIWYDTYISVISVISVMGWFPLHSASGIVEGTGLSSLPFSLREPTCELNAEAVAKNIF